MLSMFCNNLFLLRLHFLLILLYILFVVGSESQIRLTANVVLDRPIPEGTEVSLTCSGGTSNGGGSGVLRILRRRSGVGGIDGFEDLANFATRIVQVSANKPDIAATFTVSRQDDGAVFICGDVETLGFQSQTPAATVTISVQFDPRSLSLRSLPEGGMREDMSKLIFCQTDEGGANPPVNITWRHLSPLGAVESLDEGMLATSAQRKSGSVGGSGIVTQSNLTILAHRRLNGHRIECSVEKPGRIAILRQSETLEVIFAPNNVQIHPSVTGGISEGEVISLTCAVAVSHPPATVRWFEFPPDSGEETESGREISDLAQIDMTPGEYGGMLVDSTLRVSKTFRTNSRTEYRCVVNQAALKSPVIAKYKLNILYPPAIEIVGLPNDPSEGQSVTLSCLSHGGVPDKGFAFSWWHAKNIQFPPSDDIKRRSNSRQELSPVLAKSLVASLNTSTLADIFSTDMVQITGHTGRHLVLDNVGDEQGGWYGCQIVNGGGTAQSLHLLLINYAPRIHPSTKFIQYAHKGMKAEFSLMVEARPSTAEFMWFWIGDKTALANKARNLIITQSSTPRAKLRSRRSITPLKAISTSVSPWLNRVKQTSSTSNDGRMTFTLTFREVTEADYGIYMCQVNHKAGNREFYFELKRQSDAKGINPDTIRITGEGKKVRVEFEPPNSQFYSRIVLRICLLSLNSMGGEGRGIRPSGELVFLRPVKDLSTGSSLVSSGNIETPSSGGSEECGDYEITFAELGFLQLELDQPIAEYTFQFLVYQDGQLRQITRQVRWNGDNRLPASPSSKLLVQVIIGILITLLVICLTAFLIYYFCSCFKRKCMKKLAPATSNGLLHNTRTYQTLDSGKTFGSPPSGPGSISADIGLLHPAYAQQSIGSASLQTGPLPTLSIASSINEDNENRRTPASSCQSAKGFYSPQPPGGGHMANSAHQLLGSAYHPMQNADMRGSPSNVSHVSALTQRILSEVYIAAAKAASMAVSESIASGSMDAMNQTGGGTGTYRPSSHYAESVSMIGGSISGIDGLGMYQVPTPNGITRMRKSPRTATPTYQSHFTAQSPVSSAATPYMTRPRIPSQTGSGLGWASPMLTPQATMRLNEAANALAAAAAAAVLEATGAAPNLNEVQGGGNGTVDSHRSRFNGSAGAGGGGTNGGLATSSEDGESVSSNSFFSRNPNGKPSSQEASSKLQRKKLAQDSHKGSFSNPLSDCLLPMLSVPNNISPNYLQTVDPRSVRTSSTELSTFLPSISLDGPWNHNFQPIRNPRPGEETKFSPYSESQSQAEMSSTFDKTPTPSARHPAPIITSQDPSSSGSFMTIDGNTTSDNTLQENDIVSMNAKSQSQTEPPTSQTINPTHNESQK